jgi:hemoglobin/transferrin/lactoferrin receptor protein
VVFAVFCAPAWAQDPDPEAARKKQEQPKPQDQKTPDEKKAPEVVITASPLNPKDVFNTPYSSDVVTDDDIQRRRLSRTTPDALRETPGVSVQKTGPAQGSPFIRGWTGFRNLMLIDGIRLNNSVFREGPNQYWGTVDPLMIERLDLVRGPSSVLYGSDSIGGTVNAHTIEPEVGEPGLHLHSRSYVRLASAEQSYTLRQEFSGNQDDFGWGVGGTVRDFGEIIGGKEYGLMRHSGFEEYDIDLKFVYRLDQNSRLVLAAQHTRQDDAPRWHSTVYSRSWHGSLPGTDWRRDFDQERNLFYLQYHHTFEGGCIDALSASLSLHRQGEKENRITGSLATQIREFVVYTPGVWLKAGKQTGLGYFTGGFEYYHDIVNSSGFNRSAAGAVTSFTRGNVADDSTYDLFGVYLQDEFSIGPVDVTPGIRFTRAAVDAEEVDPNPASTALGPIREHYEAVTGSLRLLYHLDEHWNVIAGWGMGFRPPSLSDSTSNSVQLSGAQDVPSPGLKPEKFHTFDLGLRSRYAKWEASVFGFYTIIDDMITRVPATTAPPTFAKDNVGDGWVYGAELGLAYHLTEEVTFFADYAFAKGRVDQLDSTGRVRRAPIGKAGPQTYHLGARYSPKPAPVWVEGLVTIANHQHHIAPSEMPAFDGQRIPPGGTPGYIIFTLRGGYKISENFIATLAIENITDKDYRQHGSGQNEPGTNVILGVEAKF